MKYKSERTRRKEKGEEKTRGRTNARTHMRGTLGNRKGWYVEKTRPKEMNMNELVSQW